MGNTTTRDINDFIFDLDDFTGIVSVQRGTPKPELTQALWENNLIEVGICE